jgi:hypothetical protein
MSGEFGVHLDAVLDGRAGRAAAAFLVGVASERLGS